MIFLIALAAVIGSLIPQEGQIGTWPPPEQFHVQSYGPFLGRWVFQLGLTRLYTTWWFVGLLGSLGLSLIICTWHRLMPMHRSLIRPVVKHTANWVRARTVHHDIGPGYGITLAGVATELSRRGFSVRQVAWAQVSLPRLC